MEENQVPAEKEAQTYSVPWSVGDTWLGVVLLILLSVGNEVKGEDVVGKAYPSELVGQFT